MTPDYEEQVAEEVDRDFKRLHGSIIADGPNDNAEAWSRAWAMRDKDRAEAGRLLLDALETDVEAYIQSEAEERAFAYEQATAEHEQDRMREAAWERERAASCNAGLKR